MKPTCFVDSFSSEEHQSRACAAGPQPGLPAFLPGGNNTCGLQRPSLLEMGLGTPLALKAGGLLLPDQLPEKINPWGTDPEMKYS